MLNYLIRRLLLLPLTLFCIVLVNFVIINLAPGDPIMLAKISEKGDAMQKANETFAFGTDEQYLQFREHFGLTLPVLFNTWPNTTESAIQKTLEQLITKKESPADAKELKVKKLDDLRIRLGDKARFIMPQLLAIAENPKSTRETVMMAMRFIVRGGTRQAFLGPNISEQEKLANRKIAKNSTLLRRLLPSGSDSAEDLRTKLASLETWYEENIQAEHFQPTPKEKLKIFFIDTRFCRYMSKVFTLDFGTLRNDQNKTVLSEVSKRFKYSLTLSIIPMLLTFVLCQVVGFTMALRHNRWQDLSLNVVCLILYAIPIFVIAPLLIEKVALHNTFPFTHTLIPYSGFNSPEAIFNNMSSAQRLGDIMMHICLPLIAVMYGALASQSRLSRTAVLEVLRQDYVRTARAKGVPFITVIWKHVGRNAGITIVTSLAGSLGIILGGSLIVETIFEINGFGKFFYEAIINRDYNVIMFSALASAILALISYLIADIVYTLLDPRVTLE